MPAKPKAPKPKAKPRATPRSPGKRVSERDVAQLEGSIAAREAAPAGKALNRSSGQMSNRSGGQMVFGGEIVERKGYPRADGTRSGAKGPVRRMTLYFPPELAKQLAVQAALTSRDMSDIVSEAVADWIRDHGARS